MNSEQEFKEKTEKSYEEFKEWLKHLSSGNKRIKVDMKELIYEDDIIPE